MTSDGFLPHTFQELIDAAVLEIGDGYRAKNEELGGTGPIFLRAGHVTDTHIDFAGVERFHAELESRLQIKMSRLGDTVITTKGNSTGRTTFVTKRMPPFVYSPHLSYWRTRDPKQLANGFLRYWSRGAEFTLQLSAMKGSTDMAPYMSLTDQRRLKITLPPPTEQDAIANILGVLDDKIELNRRMNETLEGLARAIFQSWFVDFDPVRAQRDGLPPPALSPTTAALFPDSFEDSELGKIPKGWSVKKIGDLADIKHGFAFKGEFFRDEPTHDVLLTPGNFAIGGGFKEGKFKYYEGPVPEDFILKGGDLLVTMTDLSKLGDTLGYPIRVPTSERSRFLHNQRLGKVLPTATNGAGKGFLYHSFCRPEYRNHVLASASGSTVKHTSPDRIKAFQIPFPNAGVLARFERIAAGVQNKIDANSSESAQLAAIRDALLPKLLSGEIRVAEAERLVERV